MIDIFWGRDSRKETDKYSPVLGFSDQLENKIIQCGNTIYFNGDIWEGSISRLMMLSTNIIKQANSQNKPSYTLVINSYGGYVNEMFRFADFFELEIKPNTIKPTVIISTMAASAASYIAMIFPNRKITKRGTFMVHELFSFIGGFYTAMKSEVDYIDNIMGKIVDDYSFASGQRHDIIKTILLKNRWYTAKQALDAGFVNEII